MVKVLAQEMKTVGVKNFTVHAYMYFTYSVTVHVHVHAQKNLPGERYSGTTLLQHLHVSTSVSTLSSI